MCDLLGAFFGEPDRSCSQQLYIWERQIEVLARHLLLLQVAQDWELPIRQRANVFLEIFGNCLVQVILLFCCTKANVRLLCSWVFTRKSRRVQVRQIDVLSATNTVKSTYIQCRGSKERQCKVVVLSYTLI